MVAVHIKHPKHRLHNPGRVAHPPMSKFFHDLLHSSVSDVMDQSFVASRPSVNILANDQHYVLEVAAPGLEKGDFSISVEDNVLLVSANRKKQESQGKETVRQFDYSRFTRKFRLNDQIDQNGISATYQQGILSITLPRTEPKKTEKKIEIQ